MTRKGVVLGATLIIFAVIIILTYHGDKRLAAVDSVYTRLSNLTQMFGVAQTANDSETTRSWVREYYSRQAADRIRALDTITGSITNFASLYNTMVPEVYCPALVRVGTVLDGGKFVCNPHDMPKNCSIYSLGLNNEISFDVDIQEFNNYTCRIYGYDRDIQAAEISIRYKEVNGEVESVTISPKTNVTKNEYFLGDLLIKNKDTYAEILKMDIEYAEHKTLIPFLQRFSVCQILLEIHGKPIQHVTLLHQIAELDYALFSYEVNGYSLEACEYSFINLNCMARYGATIWKLYLKHVNPSEM
ncbi:hypothetical protein NECAME_08186 [Necator americanus]|nr:hypothetical protein NECAME_08186 [Necator americanus]ETN82087.1 hypothetical protein NECAME_08186 [Necator americanus]